MHPLQLIISSFFNLFSLALIATDIYLIREWYLHKDTTGDENYTTWMLILAIVCTIIIAFGKVIFKLILGRNGEDEPNLERSHEVSMIDRPEGHQIHLEYYGPPAAQPIIFIHGWSSDSTQWYYQKKHLSQDYRLILMDLPGCGKSSKKTNGQYSPERFALDLEEVVSTLRKKPIVVGHSIGGMTILSYCKLFNSELSKKIAGMVLVQTTYTNPVKTSIMSVLLTAIQKPILSPMCYVMIALAPVMQLMNWIKYLNGSMHLSNHLTGYAGTETKGQLQLTSYLSTVSPVGVVARGMLGMFNYDASDILRFIKVPTLIIAGNKDILCKPEASEHIARLVSDAELLMLQPAGHMGPMERNESLIAHIKSFVTRVSSETNQQATIL